MRKLNPPFPPSYDFSNHFRTRKLVYQKGDSTTNDPAKADVDQFGSPIVLTEKSDKSVVLDVLASLPLMPCYDVSDPVSLAAARLARQNFAGTETAASLPTTYFDKFEAYQYVSNSANAFLRSFQDLERISTSPSSASSSPTSSSDV